MGDRGLRRSPRFIFSCAVSADRHQRGVIGLLGAKFLPRVFRNEAADPPNVDLATKAADIAKPSLAARSEDFGNLDRDLGVALDARGSFSWDAAHYFPGRNFFSKAAVVTFGGAYAVLPYVSQQAVEHYHWLAPGQMLDGLGLAETTPGPLIMVLQFVGFLGAWNQPGNLSAATRRNWRGAHHHMDNVRSLLSLGLSRRALYRETTGKHATFIGA